MSYYQDLGEQRKAWLLERCRWCLENNQPIPTNQELAEVWGCDPSNMWVILKKLQDRGYLEVRKQGRRLWPVKVNHEPLQT